MKKKVPSIPVLQTALKLAIETIELAVANAYSVSPETWAAIDRYKKQIQEVYDEL